MVQRAGRVGPQSHLHNVMAHDRPRGCVSIRALYCLVLTEEAPDGWSQGFFRSVEET